MVCGDSLLGRRGFSFLCRKYNLGENLLVRQDNRRGILEYRPGQVPQLRILTSCRDERVTGAGRQKAGIAYIEETRCAPDSDDEETGLPKKQVGGSQSGLRRQLTR